MDRRTTESDIVINLRAKGDTKIITKAIDDISASALEADKNVDSLERRIGKLFNTLSNMGGEKTKGAIAVSKQAVDISNILSQINSSGIKLADSLDKVTSEIHNSLQQWTSMRQQIPTIGNSGLTPEQIADYGKALTAGANGVRDATGAILSSNSKASILDARPMKKYSTAAKAMKDSSDIMAQIDAAGIKLADAFNKVTDNIYNSMQKWASMDKWKITKGVTAFEDSVKGLSEKMNNNVNSVDDDTLDHFWGFGDTVNTLGTGTTKFQNLDVDASVGNFDKFIQEATTSLKKFDQIAPELISKLESFSNGIIESAKGIKAVSDAIVNANSKANSLDVDTMKKYVDGATVLKDASNIMAQIDDAGIKLANSLNKVTDKIHDSLQQWSSMDQWKVTKGITAFEDTIKGFSDKMKDNVNSVDDDTRGYFDEFSGVIGTLGTGATKFQDLDAAKSVGSFNKFVEDTTNSLKQFDQITPELISKLKSFGHGINESAKGLERYSYMTDQEFEDAKKRALDMQTASTWNAYNNNRAVHEQTVKDNNMWFTNMFDKSKPFMQRMKESAKMLGGDMKNVFIGGLKGLITGGLFNLALKGLQTALKIIMTPVKTIVKMGTSFARLMIKTATGTEVFKKIIELTLLPFVLLFTLMFAPILVRLAPLLVDMVQRVTEKWDVLENIGNRIAEILTVFFDDNNWFSLGSVLDTVIGLLDELSMVAYSTFKSCQEAGMTGLDAIVAVAASVIIAFVDKIVNFISSPDGYYLFMVIGELVGLLLASALEIAIAALGPTIISIFGVLGGFIAGAIAYAIRNVATMAKNIIGIGGFLSDALNGLADSFGTVTPKGVESSITDHLAANGLYDKSTHQMTINNNTTYQTTAFTNIRNRLDNMTSKQYAVPGW